jgi:hypothetical protein
MLFSSGSLSNTNGFFMQFASVEFGDVSANTKTTQTFTFTNIGVNGVNCVAFPTSCIGCIICNTSGAENGGGSSVIFSTNGVSSNSVVVYAYTSVPVSACAFSIILFGY